MLFISEIQTTAPIEYDSILQEMTYKTLQKLQISFLRVETDEMITMDDCVQVNQKLNMKMVKTLFLCNRQQTEFYLFVTTGDKSFNSKEFSSALNVSRVSFAPADLMEKILGTKIGAATVFSSLLDKTNMVKIVIDEDVTKEEWYGCSDGTRTGYLKIKTDQIINDFLPYTLHTPTII